MISAILLFPVLILGFYGLGEFIRSRFPGPCEFSTLQIARSLGFGIFTHAIFMTILGYTGLLTVPIAAIFTVLPFLIFFRFWWPILRTVSQARTWCPNIRLNPVEILLITITILITLLRGFNALAPNISWDATSHHYLVPSVWLESGRVSDLPSVIYSYYPSFTEMGIAGTMALGTDFLANLYGWLFGALAILLLTGIGQKHSDILLGNLDNTISGNPGRLAGITAAFLFTIFPGVGVQTSGGYADLPLAIWVLLTIDYLFEFRKVPDPGNLLGAAIFAGAILSTKHIGFIIVPGLIIFLAWAVWINKKDACCEIKPRWGMVATFTATALLIPLAWYIRSYVFTGNPIFPFGGEAGLPVPPHPPFTSTSWVRPDYERTLFGFITYWLHLTFSENVGHALGRNYPVAFPLLFPLVLTLNRLKPGGKLLSILALVSILVIYKLFPIETRYHLPFFGPLAIMFGLLLSHVYFSTKNIFGLGLISAGSLMTALYQGLIADQFNILVFTGAIICAIATIIPIIGLKKHVKAMFFIFIVFLIVVSIPHDSRPDLLEFQKRYKTILNIEPEDKYLLRESPLNYGAIHHINNEENWREMKILCLEPRLYRLKADWVTWFGLKEASVPTTPAENVAVWYRGGFTHILLGDDVLLKALMYYNIVHSGEWDIPGASPAELAEWIEAHPGEDEAIFSEEDLWFNLVGDPMVSGMSRHFREEWLPREIAKELYFEIEPHTWRVSRLDILTDPESLAQYSFVRDFRELVDSGGLEIAWTDELTFLFKCDYPAYLEKHPATDLETLGLR